MLGLDDPELVSVMNTSHPVILMDCTKLKYNSDLKRNLI